MKTIHYRLILDTPRETLLKLKLKSASTLASTRALRPITFGSVTLLIYITEYFIFTVVSNAFIYYQLDYQ